MHFYAQSYAEVMTLPLKTFWLMSRNVDRIQAQKDMRSLTVAVCSESAEGAATYRQRLVVEAGTLVKLEDQPPAQLIDERDEVGFAELKGLS